MVGVVNKTCYLCVCVVFGVCVLGCFSNMNNIMDLVEVTGMRHIGQVANSSDRPLAGGDLLGGLLVGGKETVIND